MATVPKSVKNPAEEKEEELLRKGSFLDTADKEVVRLMWDMDYLRFTCADLQGIGRCKSVPKRHFEQFGKRGVDLSCVVLGFGPRGEMPLKLKEAVELNFANIILMPMAGTLRSLPWAADNKYKVGEVLCETFWIKPYRDGGPQEACPRYIARKQLERLNALGFSLYSAHEVEFSVLKKTDSNVVWTTPVFSGNDVLSTRDLAEFESFIYWLDSNLQTAGISVETLQTEYGSGQFEFALKPRHGISGADDMFRTKHAIKEMTTQRDKNMTAVFMTKPDANQLANGLHYNHSLWFDSGDRLNAFHDPSDSNGLSTIAKHWIAGLIKHAPAMTALCSPTVNCYRRMHTLAAPSRANWGIDDRLAAFRVKNISASETYVESRMPGGAANPYLILAATVAAGLSGIVNKLECPPQRQENEVVLPKSLSEALEALESDKVMVESLGEEFIRWFVTVKRDFEINVLTNDDIEEERQAYLKLF